MSSLQSKTCSDFNKIFKLISIKHSLIRNKVINITGVSSKWNKSLLWFDGVLGVSPGTLISPPQLQVVERHLRDFRYGETFCKIVYFDYNSKVILLVNETTESTSLSVDLTALKSEVGGVSKGGNHSSVLWHNLDFMGLFRVGVEVIERIGPFKNYLVGQ
jgi:hypothetical protein